MKYYERNLPHIFIDGSIYFVTFRTFDSIDNIISKLQKSSIENSKKQQKIDDCLDTSDKGTYLKSVEVIEKMRESILRYDNEKYKIHCFCIMPNHIHLLIEPYKTELSDIIKEIKGYSAYAINKILNKKGKFWQEEYFDKIVRDEKHYGLCYEYIMNNPLKIELNEKERIYSIYD